MAVEPLSEAYVVAQTTLDSDFFKEIINVLIDKVKRIKIYNTICDATKERQEAIKKLAPTVDGVIVIGGKNSSNTKKLYHIAKQKNANTFHLEESGELQNKQLLKKIKNYSSMGITAGASTPYDEIETVKRQLECNI
jgi:4-hydroxy-3-methylbut-2-enyl diphosphate reductase